MDEPSFLTLPHSLAPYYRQHTPNTTMNGKQKKYVTKKAAKQVRKIKMGGRPWAAANRPMPKSFLKKPTGLRDDKSLKLQPHFAKPFTKKVDIQADRENFLRLAFAATSAGLVVALLLLGVVHYSE
jgi:hypothetical protein